MMSKEWKLLRALIKDKASLIKATVSTKRTVSTMNRAVIKATTRTSTSPPPDYRIATVLNLGHETIPSARACVESIMDRLHSTHDPYVALKCLILLHHIITTKGSSILKDQLSFFPLNGGINSLILTRFRHKSKSDTWELSLWVQWYASVLERNLVTSRILGFSFYLISSSNSNPIPSTEFDLLRELDSLVSLVEEICKAPQSLNYQKMDLVHEIMLLVSEDYRFAQLQIKMRLEGLEDSDTIDRLSRDESTELISCLKRLEDCWPKLIEMFANRKRNDAFWELTSQMKIKLELMNERRERGRLVLWKDDRERLWRELTR
ncbi:hypothetical protein M9H77_32104 [Catharanthus roseus]|uniref:Uncharacterized protein n=1 Tax=Catharanthus roseus TaxID=4058 RepID=A0ACC0A4M6_CATRO|nr:hypothetical protein M9H77_32104 [Catharanthus roseus]